MAIGVSPLSLVNPEAWERMSFPLLSTAIAIAPGMAGSGILVAASSRATAAFNFDRDNIVVFSVSKLKRLRLAIDRQNRTISDAKLLV